MLEAPPVSSPRTSARSAGPDQLKAILLVLVIFGHTFAEGVGGSFTKWLIYGFHMPAFLFLSGYLLRAERLREREYPQLLMDYSRRMLVPWLFVSVLWAGTFGTFSLEHPVRSVIDLVIAPQWHLWYVPVLFAMITLTWAAVRLPRPYLLLVSLAVVGWAVCATPVAGQLPDLMDVRYFSYLVWFVAGFLARNILRLRPHPLLLVPGLLAAAGYAHAYQGSEWLAAVSFLVLNLCLVAAVPVALEALHHPLQSWLVLMGRQSLWVYLFHPFVTTPLQRLDLPTPWQRLAGVLVTVLICGALVVLDRRAARDRP